MKRDNKDANYRKARYQFKTFFWSLNTKTTAKTDSVFQNRHIMKASEEKNTKT